MKRTYLSTILKTLFIVIIIVGIIIVSVKFVVKEIDSQHFNTVKTNMLVIKGKIKTIDDKVKIEEEGIEYLGSDLNNSMDKYSFLVEENIIEVTEDSNWYILEYNDLENMELSDILEEDIYIVDYTSYEVVYALGVVHESGNIYYTLNQISNIE